MTLVCTKHASTRMRQRGISERDLELVIRMGTPVDDESFMVLHRDAERAIRDYKRAIAALERLRGCRVVLGEDNTVITVYRPSPRNQKRIVRGLYCRATEAQRNA